MEDNKKEKKESDIKEGAEKKRNKGITFIIIGIILIFIAFFIVRFISHPPILMIEGV